MNFFKITKTKLIILFVFSLLQMYSCNQNAELKDSIVAFSENNTKPNEKPIANTERIPLKVIKTAKTKYKVKDVKMATNQIKILAEKYQGYISDLAFQNNLYRVQNDFTIKIPKQYFDVFLDSVHKHIDFIDFENISTRDVSEEYFDSESRLKTKIEVKNRYESILRKKAKTVEDILKTEEKIRIIQEEIEATKGKLNYLKNRIAYSTIEIELYQIVEYENQPEASQTGFLTKMKDRFLDGTNIISVVFLGLVTIWPLLILVFFVFWMYTKRKK